MTAQEIHDIALYEKPILKRGHSEAVGLQRFWIIYDIIYRKIIQKKIFHKYEFVIRWSDLVLELKELKK